MSPVKNIQLRKTSHRQQDVILLAFDSDPKLTGMVKQQAGACWSQTLKSWYIPEKQFDLHRFFEAFRGKAWVDYSGLKSNSTPAREKIKQKKETTRQNIQLKTLTYLREYYKEEKPAHYLFEGKTGKKYSATSIYNVVKNTAAKARIRKRIYPHILRHSFGTHNLEQGMDLRFIQELMGHESSKTTEIYTHVSQKDFKKFRNPIDDAFFDDG